MLAKIGFPVSANCCYLYSNFEVIFHNLCFVIAYVIGLNYTHLDHPPLNNFGFTTELIRKFTWVLWSVLAVLLGGIILNFYYLYHVQYISGSHIHYVYLSIALLVFSVLRTYALRKTHCVHVHHWTCGFVLLMYFGYQNVYVASFCGVLAGVMVEGAARWGFDDVWKLVHNPKTKHE